MRFLALPSSPPCRRPLHLQKRKRDAALPRARTRTPQNRGERRSGTADDPERGAGKVR